MRNALAPALICLAGLLLTRATAQDRYYNDERDRERDARREVPPPGFYPSERMLELVIDRFTERQMTRSFALDEDQLFTARELLKERFVPWAQENMVRMNEVGMEFWEAWLDDRPPTTEWVAQWAQRALPLLDDFSEQVESFGDELRPHLTEDQQIIMDAELAATRVVTDFTSRRLAGWAEGAFDPRADWHRSPQFAKAEQERQTELTHTVAEVRNEVHPAGHGVGEAADGQAAPKETAAAARQSQDEWTRYVEDFIRRYELSPEQQSRAYTTLRVQAESRDTYLRRNADRFARAEQLMKSADSERNRAQAEQVLAQRTKTIDNKFTVLKEKLNKLPTRKQRLAASEKTVTEQAAHEEPGAKRESPSSP
jgi:hypothetical protein